MEVLKFCIAGFALTFFRVLIFPFDFLFMILGAPFACLWKNNEEKHEKFFEYREDAFMRLFGPPFGFFSVAIVFYISTIIGLLKLL